MSKQILNTLSNASTIVIKIGTSQIFDAQEREFKEPALSRIANAVFKQVKAGTNIVLVASAMVGAGLNDSGIPINTPLENISNADKRYAASFGTTPWNGAFQDAFTPYGIRVPFMLTTGHSLKHRDGYRENFVTNIRRSFENRNHLYIINENDPVEDAELKHGDGDTLGATVAELINADAYVILTDVNGLYDRSPSKPGAQLLEVVSEVTDDIMAMANGAKTALSTGGMITKLEAAKQFSGDTILANGDYISSLFYDANVPATLIQGRNTDITDNAAQSPNTANLIHRQSL